jgi:hypothetical protein
MKERLKRLLMLLGAVVLLVCRDGVWVMAEEDTTVESLSVGQASEVKEDTVPEQESKETDGDKNEKQNPADMGNRNPQEEDAGDTGKESTEADDEGQQKENVETAAVSEKAADLKWEDGKKGLASFKIPNEKGTASYNVTLWCDGQRLLQYSRNAYGDIDKGTRIELFFFHYITKNGLYKFDVTTLDVSGKPVNQVFSEERQFTLSDLQLSVPYDVSWKEDGTFSCKRADEENFMQYAFEVYYPNGNCFARFGSPVIENKTETKEGISFNLSEYLQTKNEPSVTPESGFRVRVQVTSKDFETCRDSEWAEAVLGGAAKAPDSTREPSSVGQNDTGENTESEPAVVKGWEPTTPDEIKRHSFCGREKIDFTAAQGNAYGITIKNAMQGKLCFDSFEAVLGDYKIGRTYSILPSGRYIYKMDSKARITLTIPKALQAAGREYRMICVTDKGRSVVLDDLDSAADTVTFETDTYHAFALVYRDVAISK